MAKLAGKGIQVTEFGPPIAAVITSAQRRKPLRVTGGQNPFGPPIQLVDPIWHPAQLYLAESLANIIPPNEIVYA